MVKRDRPWLVIASPPCEAWSTIMGLNWAKTTAEEKEKKLAEARVLLEFAVEICLMQQRAQRYYLLEQPDQAASWAEDCLKALSQTSGYLRLTTDMCRYGLAINWDHNLQPASPTGSSNWLPSL